MKIFLAIVGLLIIGGIAWSLYGPAEEMSAEKQSSDLTEDSGNDTGQAKSTVEDGSYVVLTNESNVFWSGKKPLVDGYINTGSMEITDASIEVEDGMITGEFTLDMDTLSVTDTPTKPGQEDTLEGHLKSDRWFDVSNHPEAKFVLLEASPRVDTDTTFAYDVRGELTMKGETHELTFPATIYTSEDGVTHASADFEFDRTKWGITAGSGSFFDSLADNVIDDMVRLQFELVGEAN